MTAAADTLQAQALGCLPFNVPCLVDSWFSGLAVSALRPLLTLAGQTELSTRDYTAAPAVDGMWTGMAGISDALFLLLICAGGVILMGSHTYQGSYALREAAPRFAIAMAVSNSSLLLTSKAIGLSNGISAAVSGGALPATATGTLTQILMHGAQGGVTLILLVLAAVIAALVIAMTYVIRQMALVLLIAAAPLALSGYALPHTSWAARWWWRALAAVLAIPPAPSPPRSCGSRAMAPVPTMASTPQDGICPPACNQGVKSVMLHTTSSRMKTHPMHIRPVPV